MGDGAIPQSEYNRAVRLHAKHYARWLRQAAPAFDGAGDTRRSQIEAVKRLRLELDNVRPAVAAASRQRLKHDLTDITQSVCSGLDLAGEFLLLRELAGLLLKCSRDKQVQLQAHFGLATSLRRLGQPLPALEHALQALNLVLQLKDGALQTTALRHLAQCQLAAGQTAEARETLNLGLEHALKHGHLQERPALLTALGILDFRQGKYADARQRLRRAAEMLHALSNPEAEARALTNLGLLEIRHGNLAEAKRLLEESLAMVAALDNHREAAIRLANLGSIASDGGRPVEARGYYRRALNAIRQTGERNVQATLLGNLGMVARDEHDYMLAATLLGQAYEIHVELGNRLGQAEILRFMGIVSLLQEDPQQAALYLLRGLELSQDFGAAREIAVTAGLAGTLLARQGDLLRGAMLLHAALHQEQLHSFRYEDDVRSILNDGLDEISGKLATRGGLNAADTQRAKDSAQRMGVEELAQLTARTLRERFAYAAVPRA